MRWERPPDPLRISADEVHVWRVVLDRSPSALARAWGRLSDPERRRAERFVFPAHRERFVTARAALRAVLGAYLGTAPEEVRLDRLPSGRPFLVDPDPGRLQFTVAHSADLALIAVTHGRSVGVDVERMRRDLPLRRIAARYLAPAEVAALDAVPAAVRPAAFFATWARKEAYLKAAGVGGELGLAASLARFAVTVRPAPAGITVVVPGHPEETARWSVVDLEPAIGFAAALAVEGPARARTFHWEE